jgi:cytochrome c oxidase assembly factor CtaG
MPDISTLVVAHVVTPNAWTWTLEPGVLISLTVVAAVYSLGVARLWTAAGVGEGIRRVDAAAFAAGWLTLVVALVSPLDALSGALFSAHMVQHELLILVAAPLMVLGSPLIAVLWLLPAAKRRSAAAVLRGPKVSGAWAAVSAPATVWVLHGAALWIWHMPSLYEAALASDAVHALQHLCFFGSALLFWWGITHGRYGRIGYGAAVIYVFATAIHSGVLGAFILFSPRVWYPIYAQTSARFGLTPLEDQQLAGLLMWIPPSVIFIAIGLAFFAAWLRESDRHSRFSGPDARRTRRPPVNTSA